MERREVYETLQSAIGYLTDRHMAARKKLTDSEVRWLRKMYRPGDPQRGNIAYMASVVGCSRQHATDIIKRRRRADVPDFN